ncbi:hypothetical protein [Polaromonas sp. CG9_12]|nr:hypothetical protein [Polaromonas sp. CG9_12]CDS55265.1 hypothetical protein [Polaromonas sp. CG9_12]
MDKQREGSGWRQAHSRPGAGWRWCAAAQAMREKMKRKAASEN